MKLNFETRIDLAASVRDKEKSAKQSVFPGRHRAGEQEAGWEAGRAAGRPAQTCNQEEQRATKRSLDYRMVPPAGCRSPF